LIRRPGKARSRKGKNTDSRAFRHPDGTPKPAPPLQHDRRPRRCRPILLTHALTASQPPLDADTPNGIP
jgi:hypothetical protein